MPGDEAGQQLLEQGGDVGGVLQGGDGKDRQRQQKGVLAVVVRGLGCAHWWGMY